MPRALVLVPPLWWVKKSLIIRFAVSAVVASSFGAARRSIEPSASPTLEQVCSRKVVIA